AGIKSGTRSPYRAINICVISIRENSENFAIGGINRFERFLRMSIHKLSIDENLISLNRHKCSLSTGLYIRSDKMENHARLFERGQEGPKGGRFASRRRFLSAGRQRAAGDRYVSGEQKLRSGCASFGK